MAVSLDIRGLKEVQRALDKAKAPQLTKALQKATDAAAKVILPVAKREAPRGTTGKLRKSVKRRKARRDKPGTLVTADPKVAFYRGFVQTGTKRHRIRFPDQKRRGVPKSEGNIEHPGARANPFIQRAADAKRREAVQAAADVLKQELP